MNWLELSNRNMESGGGGSETPDPTPNGMVFPSVLNSLDSIRPVIKIRCIGGDNNGKGVVLPCPAGFGVTDGASYNDADLSFLGNVALEQISSANKASAGNGQDFNTVAEGAMALGKKLGKIDADSSDFMNFAGAALNRGIAKLGETGNGIGKGIAIGVGAILNKNVTTEFTGVGTRSFSFQYKLVPSSKEEGVAIGNITRFLRQGIYPSKVAAGSVLKYPPRWQVEFLTKIGGDTLTSVPAIAECYLESFATTYNGSNSFHDDGVPVDTDISLTFKEFRALTLEDINDLEAGSTLRGSMQD